MLNELRYSYIYLGYNVKGVNFRKTDIFFAIYEKVLSIFPKRYRKVVARYLISSISVMLIK